MTLKQNRGDIISLSLRNNFDVLFHNSRWEFGISKEIGQTFREAKAIDKEKRLRLGECSSVKTKQGITVVNAHFTYTEKKEPSSSTMNNRKPRIMVHFKRFRDTLQWLNMEHGTKSIVMPRLTINDDIWDKMLRIIDEELPTAKVTIVEAL